MDTFEIKPYDINTLARYCVWSNIGRRKSGKSTLTRLIAYNSYKKDGFKYFIVISPTARVNNDYDFLDNTVKFTKFTHTLILNIMKRQEDLIKADTKGNHDLVLILDDLANSTEGSGKLISTLIMRGRHLRIRIIMNYQALKGLTEFKPIIRDNLDVIAIFKQSNYHNQKILVEEYLSLGDKEQQKEALEIIQTIPNREEHKCLVLDLCNITDDYADFIFEYQADLIPDTFNIPLFK